MSANYAELRKPHTNARLLTPANSLNRANAVLILIAETTQCLEQGGCNPASSLLKIATL